MANLLSLNGKVVGGGAGGSGGGHAIENSSGTTLTQRDTLQFVGLNATDDSTNAKTVVDVFQDTMSLEDFEDAQNLDEGIYPISTDDSTVITADMVDHNSNVVSDVLDNIVPTQSSLIASQAYSRGDQFIYDGNLYTVIATISSGGTITIGTNCRLSDKTIVGQVDEMQFNVRGTQVSITNYTTTSNMYRFPNDGYVGINATTSGGNIRFRLVDAHGSGIGSAQASYQGQPQRQFIFVRKGMQGYIDVNSGDTSATYSPLISYEE